MTDIHTVQYVAPVFTPRDETGKVNFNIIPGYVDYLLGNGVQGTGLNMSNPLTMFSKHYIFFR